MNVVILMLAVTACYTICSLNDKYAAAHSLFLTAPSDFFVDFYCYCHSCFPPVYPFLLLYTRYFFVAHFFLGVSGFGGSVLF